MRLETLPSTAACLDLLRMENPTAVVLYLGQVDENGHAHGFHPSVPQYRNAIERVDGHIGQVMQGLAARPDAKNEDWLILVCTDHGGPGPIMAADTRTLTSAGRS